MTTAWTKSHEGQPPDFMEQVGINNQAQQNAMETVLAQLWEGYSEDQEPESEEETEPFWVPHGNSGPAPEIDPEIEELVEQLWPDRLSDVQFVVMAEMMLTERDEAGLPLPKSASDPLAGELAEAVQARNAQLDATLAKVREQNR